MPIPDFNSEGDLPEGIYPVTMEEIVARFGVGTQQRQYVTANLQRIYRLVTATGKCMRFLIYGSYVTDKASPNDIDIFLVLSKDFQKDDYQGETLDVFSHMEAQNNLGASIFWMTINVPASYLEETIEGWQITRKRTRRGILEVIE